MANVNWSAGVVLNFNIRTDARKNADGVAHICRQLGIDS
jgi:hypothetical protein